MEIGQPKLLQWDCSEALKRYLAAISQQLEWERTQNALLQSQLAHERNRAQTLQAQIALVGSEIRETLEIRTADHTVGAYSSEIRRAKIARYKAKQHIHLERARERRTCKGRSIVARAKPRIGGRFVKYPSTSSP